MRISIRGN
jgi:CBS domain-containing protein